jgi:Flp pilus assembly protein TadD
MAQWGERRPLLAKEEFSEALKLQPANLDARLALVDVLLNEGTPQPALELLQETSAAQRRTYGYRLGLARVAARKGDLSAAQLDLVKLTKDFPNAAEAFSNLGAVYGQRKDWEPAQAAFEQALKLKPNDRLAIEGLWAAYLALKQTNAGEIRYAKLAAANPKSAEVAVGLASLRIAAGHEDGAEKGLIAFSADNPNSIEALKMEADIRFRKGDLQGAEKLALQVVQANAEDPAAYSGLAAIYASQNRPQEVIKQYREVLKRSPDDVLAANNLAWLLAENGGNLDEALALAQKSKEGAPYNATVSDTLGWIYLKKNDVSLALAQFQDALRVDPKNQAYLYHLGLAQYRSDELAAAEASLRAALAGGKTFVGIEDARKALGEVRERRK